MSNIKPFLEYARMGISTIPCRRFFDEKSQMYSGKRPSISEWEKYSFEVPDEETIKGWQMLRDVWGMGLVVGPASNICCVDIDTEDIELQQRIMAQMPHSPILIKGKPGRIGKFLFRIAEYKEEIPSDFGLTKMKVLEPGGQKVAVDFFFSKAYVCLPPGLHSCGPNGEAALYYTWDKLELDDMAINNLPVLNPVVIEKIRMAVSGHTASEINSAIAPKKSDDDVLGRWTQITGLASDLIRRRTPFEMAINMLVEFDQQQFASHPYFLDRSKGHRTISARVNAFKFYSDMLASINSKKKTESELEMPEEIAKENYGDWPELKEIKTKRTNNQFNPNWMPIDVRNTVMASAQATSVDPAMIFFYMLGTFSACLGNKVIIEPYHLNKEYTETCNLYVGLVAKSGDRKSEITKIARKSLMKIQRQEQEKNKEMLKKAEVYNGNIEIRVDKIKSDIKKEIQENGPDSILAESLHKEIAEMEATKVLVRNFSIYEQENTVESYYDILEENHNGLFMEYNEWGAMFDFLSTSEGKRLRRLLLDGWDGQKEFSYKTKHNGANIIESLNISVGFCSQQDIMSHIFWRVFNVMKDNDGLMQRFMLVISDNKSRPIIDVPSVSSENINQIFMNAHNIEPSKTRIPLSLDAYDFWLKFLNENKKEMNDLKNPTLQSFYSKYDGLIIRIAANLAIMKNNGFKVTEITLSDITTAYEMVKYLKVNIHIIKEYSENTMLQEVVNLIRNGVIEDGMTTRELYRCHPRFFASTSEAIERLMPLEKANYIKIRTKGKSQYIQVNPRAIG